MKRVVIAGNRVTKEEVENAIDKVTYTKLGEKITVCHMTLVDGFEIIGKSGVVDPALYDAEIGNRVARDAAFSRVWEHMGSILQDRLATRVGGSYKSRVILERDELKRKLDNLTSYLERYPESSAELPDGLKILEKQAKPMKEYLEILELRIKDF